MAEAFSPQIGIDIGASNVRPSSPISVDMSGIGRSLAAAFSQPEPAKLTEAEYKRVAMEPFSEALKRIKESNLSPTQKKTRVALMAGAFVDENPTLSSDVKSVLALNYGIENVEEALKSPMQLMLDDFKADEKNKERVSVFFIDSLNDDGTQDEAKFNGLILDYINRENRLNILLADTKEDLAGDRELAKVNFFGSPERKVKGRSDELAEAMRQDAESYYNVEIAQKFIFSSKGTIDTPAAAQEAVAMLEKRKMEMEARILEDLRQTSLDLTSEEVKKEIEVILSPYTQKIAFLKQPAEVLNKTVADLETIQKGLQAQRNASTAQGLDIINQVLENATGIPGLGYQEEAQKVFVNTILTEGGGNNAIIEYTGKNKKTPIQAIVTSPQFTKGLTYSALSAPYTTLDSEGNPSVAAPGFVTPETEQRISGMTEEQKRATVDAGIATIVSGPTLNPAQYDASLPTLSDTLLIMQGEGQVKLEPGQLKYMFSSNFFDTVKDLSVKAPDLAVPFVATADNAIVDQMDKNLADMRRNLNVVGDYFNLVIEKGVLTLKVDQAVVDQDPQLRAILKEVGTTDVKTILEAFSRSGPVAAILSQSSVNIPKVFESLDNFNYLTANILTLPPELQQGFQKSLGKAKAEILEFNRKPLRTAAVVEGAPTVTALQLSETSQNALPVLTEYYTLMREMDSNPPAERLTQITTRLEALKESLPYKTKVDSGTIPDRNPFELAIPLKEENLLKKLVEDRESSQRVTGRVPEQPVLPNQNPAAARRIRWTDIVNAGAGR